MGPAIVSIVWIAAIMVAITKMIKKDTSHNSNAGKYLKQPGVGANNSQYVKQLGAGVNNAQYVKQPVNSNGMYANQTVQPNRDFDNKSFQQTKQYEKTGSSYKREKQMHNSMEDRNNDWLAHELQDERRSLSKINAMFEQQMEHRQHCDARMLKEYHLNNCDAQRIDTGVI